MKEWVYSPHYDFFIDWTRRSVGYDMRTFHVHKKYELYYQVDGTRRYFINDSAYLVNAGYLVLIGPDEVHKTGSVENAAHTRYVVNFGREYFAPMAGAMPAVNLFAGFETGVHVLNVPSRARTQFEWLLAQVYQSREDRSDTAAALRLVQMTQLMLMTGQFAAEARTEPDKARIVNHTVEELQRYVASHYKEDLSLTSIAGHFYMSPFYVSRLFKRTTDLSLVEYINSVRVLAAKRLLETTALHIPEVAEAAGFSTTAHFSRVFKESTGLAPQQYRKFYRDSRAKA